MARARPAPMLEGMNSSISRRRALRILGAGVALALPFTSLVRSASAEGAVTRFDTPHTLMAVVSDTPLWADAAGSLPVGIAPAAAMFEPLAAIGNLVEARDAYSGATSFLDRSKLSPAKGHGTLAVPSR